MARFSLCEGTSGSKRKKRSNEEEDDLKKRTCGAEGETSKSSENEEEDSNQIGDEVEDSEEIEATGEDGEGNTDGKFKFRIDPDVLDCSICFEPLRTPIFECRNGHIACSYCCPKLLNKCHFCCEPIGRRRCIALEKVLESIICPCQYANYGCRAILSFAEKASHEEACSHAPLFCPISNCTFSGSKTDLFCHIHQEMHHNISQKFFYDQPFLVVLEKQQPLMVLLGQDFRFFLLLNNHEIFPGNVLSVICMASNNSENEFSCELSVKTRESSLRLRTSAEKFKKWNGVHPCKAFLVVPDGFDTTNARLRINVCISKSLSSGVLK